jgi:glycine hydroxymethyltransferase
VIAARTIWKEPDVSNAAIADYLNRTPADRIDTGFLGYIAALSQARAVAPEVARGIVSELADQRGRLKLIASENYCSLATQLAMGNLLTDKYAEGFAHQRFYEGCENVDAIESYACEQACTLFNAEHAYVQPHSGADANMIAYWAILTKMVEAPALEELGTQSAAKLSQADWNTIREKLGNQRLLGMDYYSGGHLTHGYRYNLSAKMFDAYQYAVNRETGLIDYDEIARMAAEIKPLILLAGYSAYPREINFRRMREIADQVGAVFMVDMAHFAGLVAGGVFTGDANPVDHAHVVTSTTHKTLRGPRGGIVLCKKEFAEYVDKGCPLVIGGPLPHIMASKAVTFTEDNQPAFKDYARRIVENARALARELMARGLTLATGGTDNHLMLIDAATSCGLTGRQGAGALYECGVTLNFNSLPYDPNGPMITSGLRLGTPAVTTLGMGPDEMAEIAAIIKLVLDGTAPKILDSGKSAGQPSKRLYVLDQAVADEARARTKELLGRFPVYPELDLAFLQEHFG